MLFGCCKSGQSETVIWVKSENQVLGELLSENLSSEVSGSQLSRGGICQAGRCGFPSCHEYWRRWHTVLNAEVGAILGPWFV